MLVNIFISLIILPNLLAKQFSLNGFLNLNAVNDPPKQVGQISQSLPQRIYTDVLDVKITAQSAIVIDAKSGKILYQKNSQAIKPIASLTKLMTALVFLDYNPGWQKEFYTIAADRRNGNVIYLNPGEILTIKNLFYTALIVSDNDAIMALARSAGLAEEEFVKKMNEKAQALGLLNMHFADPTGLDSENKSNAEDAAKLLNYALGKDEIKKTTSTDYYEFEVYNKSKNKTRLVKLKNTDHLLTSYLNIVGGKTGSLEEVGYNLAVKIKGQQNQEIVAVVIGSQTNFDRFQDVKAIADWVFFNYKW